MNNPQTKPQKRKRSSDDNKERLAYWRATRTLTATLLFLVLAIFITTLATKNNLDTTSLFGFPLGYFLVSKGFLIATIVLVFWGAGRQNTIDQKSVLNEGQ